MWFWFLAVVIVSYLIGCLHGSVVASKLTGINLKETGVKNAGASNATIVLGKKYGALVAAIDIGKGTCIILILRMFLAQTAYPPTFISLLLFIAGAAVVLGHIFPFYMNFNGGKGTATIIGVLLALNWKLGLLAFALFVVVALLTDFIVIGVFTLYLSLILIALWKFPGIWTLFISIGLLFIAIIKHLENFKRMKRGEESRISSVFRKKTPQ